TRNHARRDPVPQARPNEWVELRGPELAAEPDDLYPAALQYPRSRPPHEQLRAQLFGRARTDDAYVRVVRAREWVPDPRRLGDVRDHEGSTPAQPTPVRDLEQEGEPATPDAEPRNGQRNDQQVARPGECEGRVEGADEEEPTDTVRRPESDPCEGPL